MLLVGSKIELVVCGLNKPTILNSTSNDDNQVAILWLFAPPSTRATVPARNKSLTDSSNDTNTKSSHSVKTGIIQDAINEVSQSSLTEVSQEAINKSAPTPDSQDREAVRRSPRLLPSFLKDGCQWQVA